MHITAVVFAWAAMVCSIRPEASQAFVPSLMGRDRSAHNINSPRLPRDQLTRQRRSKRPRPRQQAAAAGEEGEWEGSLIEMDVVEYRNGGDAIELGSYMGDGKLQPLLTREESGPNLFFHDEDAQPVPVSGGSCRIVRVLDDVYFSQRIVEDRVKNPHGEEAEDCFLLEGTLNPATVIRVERSED